MTNTTVSLVLLFIKSLKTYRHELSSASSKGRRWSGSSSQQKEIFLPGADMNAYMYYLGKTVFQRQQHLLSELVQHLPLACDVEGSLIDKGLCQLDWTMSLTSIRPSREKYKAKSRLNECQGMKFTYCM